MRNVTDILFRVETERIVLRNIIDIPSVLRQRGLCCIILSTYFSVLRQRGLCCVILSTYFPC